MNGSNLAYLEDRAAALLRGGYTLDEVMSNLEIEAGNFSGLNEFDFEDIPAHVARATYKAKEVI